MTTTTTEITRVLWFWDVAGIFHVSNTQTVWAEAFGSAMLKVRCVHVVFKEQNRDVGGRSGSDDSRTFRERRKNLIFNEFNPSSILVKSFMLRVLVHVCVCVFITAQFSLSETVLVLGTCSPSLRRGTLKQFRPVPFGSTPQSTAGPGMSSVLECHHHKHNPDTKTLPFLFTQFWRLHWREKNKRTSFPFTRWIPQKLKTPSFFGSSCTRRNRLSAVLRHGDDVSGWGEYSKTTGIRLHDSSWFGVFVPVNPVVRVEAGVHLVAHVWLHLADVDVGSVLKEKKSEKD